MVRWDVYSVRGGGAAVIAQADSLGGLPTRLVVPLLDLADVPGLHPRVVPRVSLGDAAFVAYAPGLTAIGVGDLERHLGSASHHAEAILSAIDMALTGV